VRETKEERMCEREEERERVKNAFSMKRFVQKKYATLFSKKKQFSRLKKFGCFL
jgi:hypothetical protein